MEGSVHPWRLILCYCKRNNDSLKKAIKIMSKTRARERAKDNAFKKLKKKLAAKAAGPDQEANSGKFEDRKSVV